MTLKPYLLAAAALFTTLSASDAVAATAKGLYLSTAVETDLYTPSSRGGWSLCCVVNDAQHSQLTNGTLGSLSSYTSRTLDDKSYKDIGSSFVFAESRASATWTTANSGIVHFSNNAVSDVDYATQEAVVMSGAPGRGNFPGGIDGWSYTFTAAGNGVFDLDADVSRLPGNAVTGLGGWGAAIYNVDDYNDYQDAELTAPLGEMTSEHGHVEFQLEAGKTYSVRFGSGSLIQSIDPNVHDLSYLSTSDFTWSIKDDGVGGGGTGGGDNGAVPEPASWAMMLGGFGLVGGAMRVSRRRTAVAFK